MAEIHPDSERYKIIWKNVICKENYMKDSNGKIDRHKVAACYMISIATVITMRFVKKIDDVEVFLAINETLAITVGLSLVRAFAIAAIRGDDNVNNKEVNEFENLFEEYKAGEVLISDKDIELKSSKL